MNSKASDVSEGVESDLEWLRSFAPKGDSALHFPGQTTRQIVARLNRIEEALAATLSPPLPSLEVERLYVMFSDDGQHIRKWSREPFEGSKPVDAALSALPLDGGL